MEFLIELTDTLNELTGMFCGEACSHGGACTLEPKHSGDHQARILGGPDAGRVVCAWPQLIA